MIQTTTVMTPCKFRGAVVMTPWPVLLLSSWLRFIFVKTNASMLCSGLPLGNQWTYELKAFWQMFKHVNPHHPIYDYPERLQWTVPFLYHGDEGRGKLRRAVLVTSYQPLLASKGHSFKSRLLCSVFPGERYACSNDGEESLESLHAAVGADMRSLFDEGLEATVFSTHLCLQCVVAETIFLFVCIGGVEVVVGRYHACLELNLSCRCNFLMVPHTRSTWPLLG